MTNPETILELWLGDGHENRSLWWTKDPDFDASLRDRFGAALEAAKEGELDGWSATPRGTLALIVLLDQFSRNIHRGTPAMYAADERAAALTRSLVDQGLLGDLAPFEQLFAIMPLMHSEALEDQRRCVGLLERLAERHPVTAGGPDSARHHMAIVQRWGRFPHRNAILGRASTDAELAFLKEPGSSF